jgi:hypothetical protein
MDTGRPVFTLVALVSFVTVTMPASAWMSGCALGVPWERSGADGAGRAGKGNGVTAGDDGGFVFAGDDGSVTGPLGGDGATVGCKGLACQIHSCPVTGSADTTISGKVFDPAGKNPLYDVAVFVPNAPVKPFVPGAGCYACSDLYSGDPVATALTDASGAFTIPRAPDGANIPLVVQIGKWRKLYTIPNVAPCVDNPQPDGSLRLPHNHMDGDIPDIAISTGSYDTLECLLGRIGLDAAEYAVGPSPSGRIHIFAGTPKGALPNTSPPAPSSYAALWDSKADLMKNDIVILSCEGQETGSMNQQALFDYTAAGGRVFASHWHYAWFNTGPFGAANLATWTTGTQNIGDLNGTIVTTLFNGSPFPKGVAMKQWLGNVGALGVGGAPPGELPILAARHNADVAATNTPSQPWILTDPASSPPNVTEYFSFETPPGVPSNQQCGRVVFSDLHVGAAQNDYPTNPQVVPTGCAVADLSPQEKALEFMLFDLSSCLTPVNLPPQPPPVHAM